MRLLSFVREKRPGSSDRDDADPDPGTCGACGWSWPGGAEGQLLCLNPESPHAYDIVEMELRCEEQRADA